MLLFLGIFTIFVSFLILSINTPKTILFIVTILALLWWDKAHSAPNPNNTGNYRMAGCTAMEVFSVIKKVPLPKDSTLAYNMGICTGQVNTALAIMSEIGCVPTTVTVGQFISVMNKFLQEHPEKRNMDFNDLMGMVAGDMWPCKETPVKGEKF